VLGTRPEAIKLAPVILRAVQSRRAFEPVIISTGQQADLLDAALGAFGLRPDRELRVMKPGQAVSDLTARCLSSVAGVLRELKPRMVVVQGDTASAVAGALAGFYEQVPVAHVEAGLRTLDLAAPFPEEANRQIISRVTSLHFAPTVDAKANLLVEGIDAATIEVTGNTVVDALNLLRPRVHSAEPPVAVPAGRKLILVTAHRRENHGRPLRAICAAVRQLAASHRELHFAFVTHPNPAVAQTAREHLAGLDRVTLLGPLNYLEMLRLVADSWLILTDSGGLQEEAPSFRRPVLVLRDRTERAEGVACGVAQLVGTRRSRIVAAVTTLLGSTNEYGRADFSTNPYGDGDAAKRICTSLAAFVGNHAACTSVAKSATA
jgi:UDP-N-acetylglucosamine 2-epimerase (non-hydrolysing)